MPPEGKVVDFENVDAIFVIVPASVLTAKETLTAALDKSVGAELAVASAALRAVREKADAYEAALRLAAEAKALAPLLAAMKVDAPPAQPLEPLRAELVAALDVLRNQLTPERATDRSPAVAAAPPPAPPPPPVAIPEAPRRTIVSTASFSAAPSERNMVVARRDDEPPPSQVRSSWTLEDANHLTSIARELDDVKDDLSTHSIRLAAVLQAVVAESRELQSKNPPADAIRTLDHVIRVATAVTGERKPGFITGLKRNATADWGRLAREARARLRSFDADSSAVVEHKEAPAPRSSRRQDVPKIEEPRAILFPALMAMANPLVLAGGIKKNEVLDSLADKHGLSAEWVAMQGGNPRAADSLVDRIKHGAVGAVVMLEALTGTTQIKSIIEACKIAGVPFAYGGAAGTASLREALIDLERQVGASVASSGLRGAARAPPLSIDLGVCALDGASATPARDHWSRRRSHRERRGWRAEPRRHGPSAAFCLGSPPPCRGGCLRVTEAQNTRSHLGDLNPRPAVYETAALPLS